MRYVLPLLVLLAGCATGPKDDSAYMERQYGTTCANLGLAKGSPDYANCLVRMYDMHSRR